MKKTTTIGLALGGGGIKGLAHIGLLKLLDEFNIRPNKISGTSMGAILGALYAHGLSGIEIEQRVQEHTISRSDPIKDLYQRRNKLIKWTKVFRYEKNRGGIVAAEGLFEHLFSELLDIQFHQLSCPFIACACDFYSGKAVSLDNGEVLPAIRASMAVPGVFAPVEHEQRLLVDGGMVNNLPINLIADCDVKIASDVINLPRQQAPKTMGMVNGAINIMISHITQESIHKYQPQILNTVETEGIDAFDFLKINEALQRGEASAKNLRNAIEKLSA